MINETETTTTPNADARASEIRAKRRQLGFVALVLGGIQLSWILYNLVVHHMPGVENHDWKIPAITGVLLIIFGLQRVRLKP